jgi:hypothetical protein
MRNEARAVRTFLNIALRRDGQSGLEGNHVAPRVPHDQRRIWIDALGDQRPRRVDEGLPRRSNKHLVGPRKLRPKMSRRPWNGRDNDDELRPLSGHSPVGFCGSHVMLAAARCCSRHEPSIFVRHVDQVRVRLGRPFR